MDLEALRSGLVLHLDCGCTAPGEMNDHQVRLVEETKIAGKLGREGSSLG